MTLFPKGQDEDFTRTSQEATLVPWQIQIVEQENFTVVVVAEHKEVILRMSRALVFHDVVYKGVPQRFRQDITLLF